MAKKANGFWGVAAPRRRRNENTPVFKMHFAIDPPSSPRQTMYHFYNQTAARTQP